MKKSSILLALLLLLPAVCLAQETLTISTYYPSPYGSYNELQLVPHSSPVATCDANGEGTMYYDSDDNQIKVCDGAGNWPNIGTSLTYVFYYKDGVSGPYTGGSLTSWFTAALGAATITIPAGTWLIQASFEAKGTTLFGWGIMSSASGSFIYNNSMTADEYINSEYQAYAGQFIYTTASSTQLYLNVYPNVAAFRDRRTSISALKLK